jgi:hypothetical protein
MPEIKDAVIYRPTGSSGGSSKPKAQPRLAVEEEENNGGSAPIVTPAPVKFVNPQLTPPIPTVVQPIARMQLGGWSAPVSYTPGPYGISKVDEGVVKYVSPGVSKTTSGGDEPPSNPLIPGPVTTPKPAAANPSTPSTPTTPTSSGTLGKALPYKSGGYQLSDIRVSGAKAYTPGFDYSSLNYPPYFSTNGIGAGPNGKTISGYYYYNGAYYPIALDKLKPTSTKSYGGGGGGGGGGYSNNDNNYAPATSNQWLMNLLNWRI